MVVLRTNGPCKFPWACWSAVLALVLCKLWPVTSIPPATLIFSDYQPQWCSYKWEWQGWGAGASAAGEQEEWLSHMGLRERALEWPGFSAGWVWLLCLPDGGSTCSLSFMLLAHSGSHICLIGTVVSRTGIMSACRTRLYTDAIRFVHTTKIVKSFDSSWRFVDMVTD